MRKILWSEILIIFSILISILIIKTSAFASVFTIDDTYYGGVPTSGGPRDVIGLNEAISAVISIYVSNNTVCDLNHERPVASCCIIFPVDTEICHSAYPVGVVVVIPEPSRHREAACEVE